MADSHLRIATRASKLALWQSNWVADQLRTQGATVELVEITTQGDVQQTGPIAAVGQTGVFTKEVQAAVLTGDADIAVHSLKDLPTEQVDGLILGAVPEREDVQDALVCRSHESLADLPDGALVGTGSLRRQAQLRSLRPGLQVVGIRGNLDTRLRKLDEGEYDAIVLAAAGLRRLGWQDRITQLLGPPQMLPAVGQGALGIECRVGDEATLTSLTKVDHEPTHAAVTSERAMLSMLHGGCSAPVGAWARVESGQLVLDGLVASVDGTKVLTASDAETLSAAPDLGHRIAELLLEQGAKAIVDAARQS